MKLPARILVRWETPEHGDPYLIAGTDLAEMVEDNGDVAVIGTYLLQTTTRAKKSVEIVKA